MVNLPKSLLLKFFDKFIEMQDDEIISLLDNLSDEQLNKLKDKIVDLTIDVIAYRGDKCQD